MLQLSKRKVVLVFLAAFAASGCGGEKTGKVSGTVTYEGKKVESGVVSFMPRGGVPLSGPIEDGRYEIKNVSLGEAIITVVQPPPGYQDPAVTQAIIREKKVAGFDLELKPEKYTLLPIFYADPATSDLRFNVERGDNTYNIILSRKK